VNCVIALAEKSTDALNDSGIPLCIDYAGTLTCPATRLEQLLRVAKHSPSSWLPLLRPGTGKARFWREIAARADMDNTARPLRRELLEWLELERRAGRRLVLLVDGDQRAAESLVARLPLFDSCAALDGVAGTSAERKRQALIDRFGEHGFDYVGSDPADEIVWQAARRAVVIGDPTLAGRIGTVSNPAQLLTQSGPSARDWAEALRLHQWVKNTLVFLPALLAHAILDRQIMRDSLLAFLAFGLCASSVYLINDLLDLGADRAHPRKRRRPLAAGTISAPAGLRVSALLLLAAALTAVAVSPSFAAVLSCYYVLTWAYSLRLKRVALLDVIALATLYTIRIVAGAAATGVPLSFWLLAFSVFIFLSLGFVKRYAELEAARRDGQPSGSGRAYSARDLPLIMSLGTAAGYSAIVVIALYINSAESQTHYRHHKPLWLICPLMLLWISRVWMLTARGRMHDDPVVFAVRDRVSLATLGLLVLIIAMSI
jgi:4-hydroxybenzoate polyprenyltransferase